MNKPAIPKKLLDKRIPTLIGMAVLVIALVSGIFFIGKGGGVFAPRASAETTPKNVRVTNVHDTNFTVSFITDDETAGFVKFGTDAKSVKSQAGDDRDQISGTVGLYKTHHITVRGLQQNTNYYYVIGTGSGAIFDQEGEPFQIKTAARNGAPAAAKTIYGSISTETGAPAEGSIVYVDVTGAGTMSSQVRSSGSWAIPLSNARTLDGSAYAQITDESSIIINVQGPLATQTSSLSTNVLNAQPVPNITFGQTPVASSATPAPQPQVTDTSAADNQGIFATPTPTPSDTDIFGSPVPTPENQLDEDSIFEDDAMSDYNPYQDEMSGYDPTQDEMNSDDPAEDEMNDQGESLDDLIGTEEAEENSVVDLQNETGQQTVNTGKPKITGVAPPNVVISITVNSDTQIQQNVTADENGEFSLDIAALSETLEPGEHTVSYSYTDPNTGELVEKTVTFTVEGDVEQLAQADTSPTPTPYGTDNPYPLESVSPSPNATDEAEPDASDEAEATDEARTEMPATDEGVPVSGSIGTTLALVFGGLFFIISGLWSFWISTQLKKGELDI